jgi:WhiB family redox-sensing transcriptional regulator
VSVFVDAELARTVEAYIDRYHQLERLEAEWRAQAACATRAVPPLRWFFPDSTHQVQGSRKIRRARRACAVCPVRATCLQVAITEGHEGVWAGTTDEQREAVAHLPVPVQLVTLEQEFRTVATVGMWRVVGEDEYVSPGIREHRAA